MGTLKFKAQPTNAFSATVNQMFGSSSQLLTTAKCGNQITPLSTAQALVRSWEEPLNTLLTVALNFRVRMLLKGAVKSYLHDTWWSVAKRLPLLSFHFIFLTLSLDVRNFYCNFPKWGHVLQWEGGCCPQIIRAVQIELCCIWEFLTVLLLYLKKCAWSNYKEW